MQRQSTLNQTLPAIVRIHTSLLQAAGDPWSPLDPAGARGIASRPAGACWTRDATIPLPFTAPPPSLEPALQRTGLADPSVPLRPIRDK